jgi:hypothetical protein
MIGCSFVGLVDGRKGVWAVVGWICQQPGPARRVFRRPVGCGSAAVVVESLVVVRWLRRACQIQSPGSCPLLPASGEGLPAGGWGAVVRWHLGRSWALPLARCWVEVRIILTSCGGKGKKVVSERKVGDIYDATLAPDRTASSGTVEHGIKFFAWVRY